jgi:hypothetical protein
MDPRANQNRRTTDSEKNERAHQDHHWLVHTASLPIRRITSAAGASVSACFKA